MICMKHPEHNCVCPKTYIVLDFLNKMHGWYLKETYFFISLAMCVHHVFYCSSSHIGTSECVLSKPGSNINQKVFGGVSEWGFATSGEFRFYPLISYRNVY